MPTPIIPRNSTLFFQTARVTCGNDSAKSVCARLPTGARGREGSVVSPQSLRPFVGHAAHSDVSPLPSVPVPPHSPCQRRDAHAGDLVQAAAPSLFDPVLLPEASHRAPVPRWRLSTAGFHFRRPAGCAWSHFFPRSVGFGPTDSCANGAFTMAPSTLCHAQATPSKSSYSANPFRHRRTKTPLRFQSRKYLWIELALPNRSSGRAFHWHPVRNTYTMPSNTRRGSIGLRPPPGRRRYFRPFPRLRTGISGSAFAHSSSETIQERVVVVMGPCCPITTKHVNNIIYG